MSKTGTRGPTDEARAAARVARATKVDHRFNRLQGILEAVANDMDGSVMPHRERSHRRLADASGIPLSTYWRFLKQRGYLKALADGIIMPDLGLPAPDAVVTSDPVEAISTSTASDIESLQRQLETYACHLTTAILELESVQMNETVLREELDSCSKNLAEAERKASDYLADLKTAVARLVEHGVEPGPALSKYAAGASPKTRARLSIVNG